MRSKIVNLFTRSIISRRFFTNKKDAKANQQQKMCPAFKDLICAFGYQDTFRHLYPNKIEYTFHRANTASRLDRLYVGQLQILFIVEVSHVPVSFSDHVGLHIRLHLPNIDKPPPPPRNRSPYWKLNTSILKEPDCMINFIKVWEEVNLSKGDHTNVKSHGGKKM